jgi:hypothetical protein
MKRNSVRQISLGLAAGLAFFLGCARPSAQPEQPRAIVAPPPIVQEAPTVVVEQNNNAPAPAPGTNAPAIVERIPPVTKSDVALSPGLNEVVKLAQSGVSEEVILAYVDKYSGSFNVGSDQILYLNDLGVSGTVITSMLKHDGSTAAAAAAPPSNPQAQPIPTGGQAQPMEAPLTPQIATAVAPPPSSAEVSYFYDSLSPYGSWVYLSGYGWCWQPTVAVSVSTWRPYCDRGRWYWSDAGWYWNSDYSWGWATFHYGRWYHHPGCGWVWTPGLAWAPSWVSWRYSDGYCGWAPLPPEAHFVHGAGFTYFGRHVSVGFEFGLTDFHYAFVDIGHFCDYAPYRHVVSHTQVKNIYRNTTVVNNYIVGNNNTVINRGIGRETIARSSQTRIREVTVRDAPAQNLAHASARGDHVERQGNQTVVYRQPLPKTPPPVKTATFVSRSGNQTSATVGRSTTAASSPLQTQPSTVSRTQIGTGTRGQTATTVQTPGGNTPEPTRNAPITAETHRGKPVTNPRATTGVTTEPKTAPNTPTEQRTVLNNNNPQRVQQQQQQAQQPRVNKPLFGDVNRNAPQQSQTGNGSFVRNAPQSAVTPPSVPTGRVYPQNATPGQSGAMLRNEPRNNAPATMSPRQYEQTSPRNYSAPVYSAPQAPRSVERGNVAPQSEPRHSSPNSGSSGSSSGHSSSRSDSGSSRSDRFERGR